MVNRSSLEGELVCHGAAPLRQTRHSSDGLGGVTGVAPTEQAAASNMMFNLYSPLMPAGGLIQNIGVGSCHLLVPEPSTLLLSVLALLAVPVLHRRHQRAGGQS